MKYQFLIENKSRKLLVFFAGVGARSEHFSMLEASFDVVIIYDYSKLFIKDGFFDILKNYQDISVLAHSMGVMIASKMQINASYKLAINGTYKGIDRTKGIHPGIFKKNIKDFDLDSFKKALFKDKLQLASSFDFDSFNIILELKSLYALAQDEEAKLSWLKKTNPSYFEKALLSIDDELFPPKAVRLCYQNIKELDLAHFIFFDFNTWDEICMI